MKSVRDLVEDVNEHVAYPGDHSSRDEAEIRTRFFPAEKGLDLPLDSEDQQPGCHKIERKTELAQESELEPANGLRYVRVVSMGNLCVFQLFLTAHKLCGALSRRYRRRSLQGSPEYCNVLLHSVECFFFYHRL